MAAGLVRTIEGKASIEVYKDKKHGWMKPDMPVYDPDAAECGWAELFALYGRTLKGGV